VQAFEALLGLVCELVVHPAVGLVEADGVGLPDLGAPVDHDVVAAHLLLDFGQRDGSAGVLVDLVEEVADLLLGQVGVDVVEEPVELLVVEFHLLALQAQVLEHLLQVDVLGSDLEPQSAHHRLQLVLDRLVVDAVLLEQPFEDLVLEHFVPRSPLLLLHPQHPLQKVLSHSRHLFLYLQGFGFDIFDQFIHRLGDPGGPAMQQFVEDYSHCPNIALGSVGLSSEHFCRHIQRSSY